jgi:hypothetical protein
MVIELTENKVENALCSIDERTRFMLCVQILCVIAVLTIIGFHSKFAFNGGLQMDIKMPLFPCCTTTVLAVTCIYYQVQRASLNYLKMKLICSYLKDGAIIIEE